MAKHEQFHYKSLDELKNDIARLEVEVPVTTDLSVLGTPVNIGTGVVPNRIGISPMEGCDGELAGGPSDLTRRRYERFGAGGAGLLWFEAMAVVNEGRANPRQLFIHRGSQAATRELLQLALKSSKDAGWQRPYTVVQLTHSGRHSKPGAAMEPIVAFHHPALDARVASVRVITDDEIEQLEDRFVEAATIACECGFDAVDIKACHNYLLSELLAGFTREGRYGGSFENRTRALTNVVDKIRAKLGDRLEVAVRLGVYDQFEHPYAFGADANDYHQPDYTEPARLMKLLHAKGVKLFGISLGSPYYNPHLTRPFNQAAYVMPYHPLEGVALLLDAARRMQAVAPDAVIMDAGISWLRQFAPNVVAAAMQQGWFKVAGFGRQAIAFPGFAGEILKTGALNPLHTCDGCGFCTTIMRDGGCTGCVVRDKEVYVPIYKQGRAGRPAIRGKVVAEHL